MNKIILLLLIITVSSCVIPVNLNYETAEIRKKGDVAFTGSVSHQLVEPFALKDTSWLPKQLGFGARMDIGVGERTNLSFRYENSFLTYDIRQHFIECQLKFALGKHYFENEKVKVALGIPMQFYIYEGYEAYILNPRLYFTFFTTSPNVRFTIIPKMYIIYDNYFIAEYVEHPVPGAGISFNCAFSSNLEKWAIVPELGFLGSSLSFGCGFVCKF